MHLTRIRSATAGGVARGCGLRVEFHEMCGTEVASRSLHRMVRSGHEVGPGDCITCLLVEPNCRWIPGARQPLCCGQQLWLRAGEDVSAQLGKTALRVCRSPSRR